MHAIASVCECVGGCMCVRGGVYFVGDVCVRGYMCRAQIQLEKVSSLLLPPGSWDQSQVSSSLAASTLIH